MIGPRNPVSESVAECRRGGDVGMNVGFQSGPIQAATGPFRQLGNRCRWESRHVVFTDEKKRIARPAREFAGLPRCRQ